MRRSFLLTAVRKALLGLGVPCAGETIVAGLSGGADSVALLDALLSLGRAQGFDVVAAHLDHGLRPGSEADAHFCRDLCRQLGAPLRTQVADVRGRAVRDHGGVEEAARIERYRFLRQVRLEENAVAVAVAHTRDDQAETFLLRLLRGAGGRGLGSMRPLAGDIVRPLLGVSRAAVLAHLHERGLAWREDPSNADPSLTRNRVRLELLPYLESRFNPALRDTLARSARLLADEADLLGQLGQELFERVSRHDDHGVALSLSGLRSAPRALARLALRRALEQTGGLRGVGSNHVERVLGLALSPSPSGRRLPLPGGRVALFRFDEVCVARRTDPSTPFLYTLPVPGQVDLPGGRALVACSAPGPVVSNGETAVVAAPAEPLTVRTRRPGDRIRAHGREVSLKRFLMEQRVPADVRASLPLVASGERVLWVPGQPVEAPGEAGLRFVRLELLGRPIEDATHRGEGVVGA